MKYLVLILLLFLNVVYANSVNEAFRTFYESKMIDYNHCGLNIQNFLKFLKENNVQYREGYVVSVHDDFANLNHFDARWSNSQSYENGKVYFRKNWYFHVFVVIDGIAYDFSQKDAKTQDLDTYLMSSYVPRGKIKNSSIDKEYVLNLMFNQTLKIYSLVDYRENLGPIKYEGSFIEMFKRFNNPKVINENSSYETVIENFNGSVTILNPKLKTNRGELPFLTYSKEICQTLGFAGAFNDKTHYNITDGLDALKMSTQIKSNIRNPQLNVSYSYEIKKTQQRFKRDLFHIASQVTCGNLSNFTSNQKY